MANGTQKWTKKLHNIWRFPVSYSLRKSKPFLVRIKKVYKTSAYFIPLCLAIIVIVFLIAEKFLQQEIKQESIVAKPLITIMLHPYPQVVLDTFLQQQISAQAAVVMDSETKTILFAKNATLHFSTASTAKIMTALVALDYYKLNDILTVYTAPVEGSRVGFLGGEKLTFENMLYGMMLPSGNDAALAIAQNYPGGEQAFVAKMNEKAKVFHLVNTHFSDPIGLDDYGDYTTATELATLASLAMQNAEFRKVVGMRSWTVTTVNTQEEFPVKNLNILLGYDGIVGVKTGSTDEAGEVLVTAKQMNDLSPLQSHLLITVVMRSDDRFADTKKILSAISHTHYITLSE